MKKTCIILSLIALIGLSATSCNKSCSCKVWVAGVSVDSYEVELDQSAKKCKDLNTFVESEKIGKSGLECK
ncbi:MAG: hypothetical protein RR356_03110 [Bacteroidales bacterium]